MIRRFGEPVADLGPGLYWRWPWPVEDVLRVQPARINSVEIGFRSSARRSAAPSALAWSSPHAGDGISRMDEEAVMITGDGDLVELQATIRYVIAEPRAYLFGVRDVDAVLRTVTEATLREMVAGEPFLDLLTTERERFQQQTLRLVRERCQAYGGLGIRLDGISLHDLHPPQEVVAAYHEVTQAMAGRERQIKEAEADAVRKVGAAEANAVLIERQAQAAAHEAVTQVQAATATFAAKQELRTRLSRLEEAELFADGLLSACRTRQPAVAYQEYQRRRRARIAAQTALTDFRLLWDALSQALVGRDKVIIDGEKLPGRRHLLLFDADQFRIPLPMLMAPERSPRSPRNERKGNDQ